MLPFNRWLCCCLSAMTSVAAFAQAVPTPPEVDERKIPDWVKRQALSPYKVIIESNTARNKPAAPKDDTRPRSTQGKVPPVSAAAAPTSATDASAAAAIPPPIAAPDGAVGSVVRNVAPGPPAAAVPEPVRVPAPEPSPAPETAVASATRSEPATPAAAASERPEQTLPLTLLRRVEPVLSPDLLDDRLNTAGIVVAFTVNPDGEVVNLSVASTTDSRLNRSVLRAVKDWRYAPIESPRQHTVRFAFTTQ